MAKDNTALLGKALGTDLAVSPAAETVALKPPEQKAAPVDFSAAKADKPLPVKEDYMTAIKPDMDALRVAEEEKLKFAGLEKIDLAEREAAKQYKLSESAAQQKKEILDDPARAEYKKALEDKAKPFVPHQENAEDMMMLFGLLNVVGFAIGSGGKEYSQAAMSAMNGMLEGHQKGRDDLYKKEKSIFETNQKQLDSRIKQLLAFMQDNELLTNMDKTARDQAIQSEFLQTGATFLSEYYKKNGYGKTVETLKEMARASGKAAELVAKEQARAAEQDFSLRLETQKAKETRERERDKVLAQYDLASLKLNEEAKQAKANRDFRLEEEKLRRAFEIEKAKADWTHGENLAEINRKHATDIELARIERDKLRDRDTAEYRLKDKEYQDKRLKLDGDRLAETERHDKEKEKLEARRLAENERRDKALEKLAREKMSHAEKMRELGGVRKTASATNERYANTVLRSSNEVLRSLELIENLGITTGGGVLGSVVGKGNIPSEIQRSIGQTFTEESERNYNTAMSGAALELAYVLNGGYKPDVGTINKLETLLSVGPNDTYGNAAYKFSDVAAKLKAAIETSPAYTDDQKATKEKILQKLDKYATPEQVQQRIYGRSRAEEPAVRAGKTYEPKTTQDFNAIPSGSLYKDPDDGKIYRKK